jgi:hypothetical protein
VSIASRNSNTYVNEENERLNNNEDLEKGIAIQPIPNQ